MDKESRRQALVDALMRLTPEMRKALRERKKEGKRDLKRPDFVWHLLLQSFSTLDGSRDWPGLMGAMENYNASPSRHSPGSMQRPV